jgi:imidazolonepropionase-like amidohydrolase
MEAIRIAAANLALLREAKVPIAFGNDASYGFSLVARPVDELAAMQRAGMDAGACLRAATSEAAKLLGCTDRGVLAAGKRADLLVADVRAKDDVSALETPHAVIAAGEEATKLGRVEKARVSVAFLKGIAATLAAAARKGAPSRTRADVPNPPAE